MALISGEAERPPEGGPKSESVLARLSQQLAALEKRDWELWVIVTGSGMLIAIGMLALLFPSAILREGNVHVELVVSRQLFFGLIVLLVLFNTYVISRRLELRRTRNEMISSTLQNELVRLQSFVDPLTEVYNRRSLDEMSNKYISRARRSGKPLTFMLLDVDAFKDINTQFGHLTGDFVLAELAALLRFCVRGADAVVRYGGDEFLIILADATVEGSDIVSSRIHKSVDEWNRTGHLSGVQVGFSIGVAEWSPDKNLDQILGEADQNMYANKAERKREA